MLVPKKVAHRKWQRTDQIRGVATRGNTVAFGQYGLKSQESGFISSRQIESARRAMTRFVQRGGKIWIRIFPDRPMTTHGAEMPMGKGKGAVDHYVAVVRPGTVMFEIDGVTLETAKQALKLAAYKLSVKTKLVIKN